jgi:hypothetical protein
MHAFCEPWATVGALSLLAGCGSSSAHSSAGASDGAALLDADAPTWEANAPTWESGGVDVRVDAALVDGAVPVGCAATTSTSALPAGAPALQAGVWKNISPAGVNFHSDGKTDVFTQGITLDPCSVATLYLSVSSFDVKGGKPGVYKSVDAGSTWTKVGNLDEPIHIRVDPKDPNHLVAADGVRGGTQGFWVSRDGGNTWTMPPGFDALKSTLYQYDVYDVAADPADFDHLLVTSHSPWNGYNAPYNSQWGDNSGVLESKDGGASWTLRGPVQGWSHGNGVWFLSDSNTWLFGSQADGFWRTSDGGVHWMQVVSGNNMQHGGGGIFRTTSGVVYAGGTPHLMRSRDDGVTWDAMLGPSAGFNSIIGDGKLLYTAPVFGPGFITAPEADDTTWTAYAGGPSLTSGPFEMAFDAANGNLYAGNWSAGVWALKVK